MSGLATMVRRFLNSVLALLLMLSVSAAGFGYASGVNHCWMMAMHGHSAQDHCAPSQSNAQPMTHMHHAGMGMEMTSAAAQPASSSVSSPMPGCQCCVGPVTSTIQPNLNASLTGRIMPVAKESGLMDAPAPLTPVIHSRGQRAPPLTLLVIS